MVYVRNLIFTLTRCFVVSKTFRFFDVVFLHIEKCFSILSALKLRPHTLQADIPSSPLVDL